MPNWCDNTINISGPNEVIKKLVEFVGRPLTKTYEDKTERIEEPIFSLENIKPSTHDLGEAPLFPSSGPDDWYHNNINSWGTKWDVMGEGVGFHVEDGAVYYGFSSAWSPVSPVIRRLAEIFPEVEIEYKYYETGCDFWGIEIYKNGELKSEDGGSLDHSAWEALGVDCYQCEQYGEDPEEYGEYLYEDCPPYEEWKAKQPKEEVATA